jgi:hypothetical protein
MDWRTSPWMWWRWRLGCESRFLIWCIGYTGGFTLCLLDLFFSLCLFPSFACSPPSACYSYFLSALSSYTRHFTQEFLFLPFPCMSTVYTLCPFNHQPGCPPYFFNFLQPASLAPITLFCNIQFFQPRSREFAIFP